MLVEQLQLSNFRNISSAELEPDAGLNLFVGSNGHGKTSILEAVGILGSLRSFRDAKPADWIRVGETQSELTAAIVPSKVHEDWRSRLSVTLSRINPEGPVKKRVQVNQKIVRSSAQYLRMKFGSAEMGFHTIAFNPNDHDLVRGEPSERRSYLDRILSAEDPDYLDRLLKYQSTLDQRNRLLKERDRRFYSLLPEFTEPLIELGSELTLARLRWITGQAENVSTIARKIAPQQPRVGLIYSIKWLDQNYGFYSENGSLNQIHFTGHTPLPSLQELNARMRSQFASMAQDEERLGNTLVGPHRDDWSFEFNGMPLRGRGSQGEMRTALLALKLTEIESFRRTTHHRPILLLDDFSSELDFERRSYLMSFLQGSDLQVLISSTESVGLPGKKFLVERGQVVASRDR